MIYKVVSIVIRLFLIIIISIVSLRFMLSIILFISHGYIGGRDTIVSFDDGRFQLIKFDAPDIRLMGLYDASEEKMIENDIYFWRNVDDKVYFIVKDWYGILEVATGVYSSSSNINDFILDDQYILGGLYIMKE